MIRKAVMNEQIPPGTVVNFGFLLKVNVIGDAYISQDCSQYPILVVIEGLLSPCIPLCLWTLLNDILCCLGAGYLFF